MVLTTANQPQELETLIHQLKNLVKDFDYMPDQNQKQIKASLANLADISRVAQERLDGVHRLMQHKKKVSAAERKAVRDKMIPVWCEENLKPGMIVKVKANSNAKFREIEKVIPGKALGSGIQVDGIMTGRHVDYVRRRNLETLAFQYEMVRDGYITNHVLRNVQGVVTGLDERGKVIVTPIMDLVEGKVEQINYLTS